MKVAVMGAGGIGSYLGGKLAQAGVDATLICRGRHLEAVRRDGLRVSSPGEQFHIESMKATARPEEVGPVDVIVQTVKLYDLESSTRQMLPMVGPGTLVLTMQNGVSAADEVAEIVGRERVIAGLTFMNSHVVAPGVVSSKSEMNTIVFGEPDGRSSPRVESLQKVCVAAGIDARVSPDIRAEQWRKFIPVAGLSAMSSLTRQPLGPIRDDPPLRRLYRQAMDEVASLAKAKGVGLEPDIVDRMLAVADRYKYDARVSMLEDLEAGKPLELDWLSGFVSREAGRLGVPAPFHDIAYACLSPFKKGAPNNGPRP